MATDVRGIDAQSLPERKAPALQHELEAWNRRHPGDAAVALELGQLLLDGGKAEDAWIVVDRALANLPQTVDEKQRGSLIELQNRIDSHD